MVKSVHNNQEVINYNNYQIVCLKINYILKNNKEYVIKFNFRIVLFNLDSSIFVSNINGHNLVRFK